METFAISQTTQQAPHHCGVVTLRAIKEHILGKRYRLSLVFIGTTRSHTLNQTYRGKDHPTNVLAFPLSTTAGEVFITMHTVMREAKKFNRTPAQHTCALFIHACLHLKGYTHGHAMEEAENRLSMRFMTA